MITGKGEFSVHDTHPIQTAMRFGVFEADFKARELRKQGVRVKLQDQPFQVLRVLLEHSGEVVGRETFIVCSRDAPTFRFVGTAIDANSVCRPCATSAELCVSSSCRFNTSSKCFRAGIVSGKLLIHHARSALGAPHVG